jgi:hypothetical protein
LNRVISDTITLFVSGGDKKTLNRQIFIFFFSFAKSNFILFFFYKPIKIYLISLVIYHTKSSNLSLNLKTFLAMYVLFLAVFF